jgi:hypothetical protein
MHTRAASILLLSTAIILQAADKPVGGPYVINVTSKSATVVYLVQREEASLGTDPEKMDRKAPVLRAEKVSFSNLQPGKTYYYDVGGPTVGKGSFKAPPAGPSSFQFVVYGDTRTRHDVHKRVIGAIVKHGTPDFVIHTGDLVSDGADSALWPIFFDIERDLLRKTAFFPSLGNHEKNNRQYYDFFDVTTPYYSFDWGTSHFVVLNSDIGNAAQSKAAKDAYWTEQVRWLEDDLAKSQKADFRFVVAHHPPITAVSKRQDSNQDMVALIPLFEKHKVNAAFFGHDHNYQHFLKNGIHYFVTGGGGAPLYDVGKPPAGITQKVLSTEHFVSVKVDAQTVNIEAIGLDGSRIDSTQLHR